MHRMQGVLPSFHLFTLFKRGTLMETNRTLSRRALTVQDMTVASALQPSLPPVATLRCDLRPSPGTATRVANEEKREVLLPWGRCLAVSRSLGRPIVSWLSSVSLSVRSVSTQSLSAAAYGFSSPRIECVGLQAIGKVTSPKTQQNFVAI